MLPNPPDLPCHQAASAVVVATAAAHDATPSASVAAGPPSLSHRWTELGRTQDAVVVQCDAVGGMDPEGVIQRQWLVVLGATPQAAWIGEVGDASFEERFSGAVSISASRRVAPPTPVWEVCGPLRLGGDDGARTSERGCRFVAVPPPDLPVSLMAPRHGVWRTLTFTLMERGELTYFYTRKAHLREALTATATGWRVDVSVQADDTHERTRQAYTVGWRDGAFEVEGYVDPATGLRTAAATE